MARLKRRQIQNCSYVSVGQREVRIIHTHALLSPSRFAARFGKVGPGPVLFRPSARAIMVPMEPITWATISAGKLSAVIQIAGIVK